MVKIVVINGENSGREFILTKGKFKIGRTQDKDLLLGETVVSRDHAEIKYKNGRYLLVNFGRNGTKVNGELVRSRYLEDGDEIEIGSTFIKYQGTLEQDESRKKSASKENKKVILTFVVFGTIFLIIFSLFSFKMRRADVSSSSMKTEKFGVEGKINSPENYFKLARRLYREREIKEENLFLAIQFWQKGLSLMGKSDSSETIAVELKVATDELDRKIKDEMFGAYQAYYLGNLSSCKLRLERVLKLIPSSCDKRYQSALAKLKTLSQK